ncbi:sigma-54-dependent transcriptional regulator [Candidatus Hydrogenedentota bacterium]
MNESSARILIVDDETAQRIVLTDIFDDAGHSIESAPGVNEARSALSSSDFDLVITDVRMPDGSGMDLLKEIRERNDDTEVIIMTAFGEISEAVQAIKDGAVDYIKKPFESKDILHLAAKALAHKRLRQENRELRGLVEKKYKLGGLIGGGPAMTEIFGLIERATRIDSTVLIEGESGTGKELAARGIHFSGKRKKRPFVVVNCAAIPETLVESELFGHEKGAFTGATARKDGKFQMADGGTILLDEIGDMPINLQAKLLRVLQDKKVERVGGSGQMDIDVRVLASTNTILEDGIRDGKFREDLFFRLNVIRIQMPPLREKKEDICLLVDGLSRELSEQFDMPFPEINSDTMDCLMSYSWPGNVRELRNTLERMISLVSGRAVAPEDLPREIRGEGISANTHSGDFVLPARGVNMEEVERAMMVQALERTRGQIKDAAALLGLSYKTMQYRVKKYGIEEFKR